MTTAEAAAEMVRTLPLDDDAEVVVLGDTAYESSVVEQACEEKGYTWVFPANPERVYEGATGQRPKLRSRLKDWTSLSLKTIRPNCSSRWGASTGKYAGLSASVEVACWAENETTRVLRLSGETSGAERWRRADRFFDNETRPGKSDA